LTFDQKNPCQTKPENDNSGRKTTSPEKRYVKKRDGKKGTGLICCFLEKEDMIYFFKDVPVFRPAQQKSGIAI